MNNPLSRYLLDSFLTKKVFYFRRYQHSMADIILLKKALQHPSRNLDVSAEWMMADFEHNKRASWTDVFRSVKCKGCHFHYAKVDHNSMLNE